MYECIYKSKYRVQREYGRTAAVYSLPVYNVMNAVYILSYTASSSREYLLSVYIEYAYIILYSLCLCVPVVYSASLCCFLIKKQANYHNYFYFILSTPVSELSHTRLDQKQHVYKLQYIVPVCDNNAVGMIGICKFTMI